MMRVKISALVKDAKVKDVKDILSVMGEVEKFETKAIEKEPTIDSEYSFNELLHAAEEMFDGMVLVGRSLWKVSKWSVITLVTGLRWLWKRGVGSSEKVKTSKKK